MTYTGEGRTRSAVEDRGGGSRPSIVVGRIGAIAITALYFFFIVRAGDASMAFVVLVLLIGLAALAAVFAWYSSSRGALALAAAALALAAFGGLSAAHDRVLAALVFGLPYFVTALVLWFGSRRAATADTQKAGSSLA